MPKQKPYHVIEGRIYLRVTEVLGWFRDPEENTDPGYLKELANIGDFTHKSIEADLKGKKVPTPKSHAFEVASCMKAYYNWKESRKPKPVDTEFLVYSNLHGLSGTIDMLEEDTVTEWKTTSKISRKHLIQANGYLGLLQSMPCDGAITQDKARIVRFDRTLAIWEEVVREFDLANFNLLVKMAQCYRAMFADMIKQWEAEEGCLLIASLS